MDFFIALFIVIHTPSFEYLEENILILCQTYGKETQTNFLLFSTSSQLKTAATMALGDYNSVN